jgi:hypothetical protein
VATSVTATTTVEHGACRRPCRRSRPSAALRLRVTDLGGYDDAQSIAEKGAYFRSKGLGGVIVWRINRGYTSSQNPILDAVRTSFL